MHSDTLASKDSLLGPTSHATQGARSSSVSSSLIVIHFFLVGGGALVARGIGVKSSRGGRSSHDPTAGVVFIFGVAVSIVVEYTAVVVENEEGRVWGEWCCLAG